MFSPATILCMVGFFSCVLVQSVYERSDVRYRSAIEGLALIYIGYLEIGLLVAALVCSVISIEKIWIGEMAMQGTLRSEDWLKDERISVRGPTARDAVQPEDVKEGDTPHLENRPPSTREKNIIHLKDFKSRKDRPETDEGQHKE